MANLLTRQRTRNNTQANYCPRCSPEWIFCVKWTCKQTETDGGGEGCRAFYDRFEAPRSPLVLNSSRHWLTITTGQRGMTWMMLMNFSESERKLTVFMLCCVTSHVSAQASPPRRRLGIRGGRSPLGVLGPSLKALLNKRPAH